MGRSVLLYGFCGIFILASTGLICDYDAVYGIEPPILLNVKARATVELDPANGIYTYSYTISNPATNTGQIWSIEIDMLKPQNGADVGREGIEHEPGSARILEPVAAEELAKEGKALVPVGLYSPKNWGGGPSVHGTIGWGSDDVPYRIHPGQSLSGFRMISRGLPGIRTITIYPRMPFELLARDDDPPEEQARKDALIEEVAFKGKTIGPTAPPAKFVALDFLSYLSDLKHQAQTQGWIGGPKFVAELDKKLDQVKEKLQANNIPSARGKLKSFINKVESQFKETNEHEVEKVKAPGKGKKVEEKKFIISEGYGLLKFNAIHLRDQLGSGEKPEEETDSEKDE